MKKFLIYTLLGVFIIAALGFFIIHSYINSPVNLEKIRVSFSQKFGGELSFKSMHLNPLSGILIKDVQLKSNLANGHPFLTMPDASLQYSPLALLRKKIKINSIDFDRPHLDFVLQDNNWQLPEPQTNFFKHALTLSTGHNTFTILLDNISLKNASVDIRAGIGTDPLFQAHQINLNGQLLVKENQGTALGSLSIQTMKFGSGLTLNQVNSSILYADDKVQFKDLRGTAYGGKVEGAISIPAAKGMDNQNYGVYLHFSDIDFPSLVKDFKADPELIHAKINLFCDLWGDIRHPSLVQGKGYFESNRVQLTGFKVLDIVGNLLNQPKLRNTHFDTVRGWFKISDDHLTFYSLEIISNNIKISASGTLNYDENIDFDVLLTVNPILIHEISPTVAEQFSTQPDGSKTISFKVSGKPDSPISNLSDKLYGKPPGLPSTTAGLPPAQSKKED